MFGRGSIRLELGGAAGDGRAAASCKSEVMNRPIHCRIPQKMIALERASQGLSCDINVSSWLCMVDPQ